MLLVALTGITFDRAGAEEARTRGFSRILEKPILPDALVKAVADLIESDQDRALRATARRAVEAAAQLRSGSSSPAATTAEAAAKILDAASGNCDTVLVVVADDEGRCVAATDSVRTLIGYEQSDLQSLSMWDLASASDAPAVAASLAFADRFRHAGGQLHPPSSGWQRRRGALLRRGERRPRTARQCDCSRAGADALSRSYLSLEILAGPVSGTEWAAAA